MAQNKHTTNRRAFHARAAVTRKARSPSVVRRVDGMTSVDVDKAHFINFRRCCLFFINNSSIVTVLQANQNKPVPRSFFPPAVSE